MGTETSGLVFYAWRADHYLRRTLWAGGVDIMLYCPQHCFFGFTSDMRQKAGDLMGPDFLCSQ